MKLQRSLILLFILNTSWSFAGLQWTTTEATQTVGALAEEAVSLFSFKNVGDSTVTITAITSNCGCTTAGLEKKIYEPGEVGEISAKFKIGGRQGLQIKTVQVITDDGSAPTVLTMKTTIPRLVEIAPAFVFWKKGEAPDMKTVTLSIGADDPIRILAAESENATVTVQLEEIEAGKKYRIDLFPNSTDETLTARVKVTTDYPPDKPRTYYLFAHIK